MPIELFEEQFEIIMKAFHEASFSHKGKHYTLLPAVPTEVSIGRSPWCRVPSACQWNLATDCQWQPTWSRFLARHDIKGMILGTATEYVERWMHLYQEQARHGRQLQLGENLGLGLGAIWMRRTRK